MRAAIRDPVELCQRLGLSAAVAQRGHKAAAEFPVFVPREFLARMRWGDETDPLLRQVLPLFDETKTTAGYQHDPVGDHAATLQPGLVKKYRGRVLLIVTGTCAVHCRYCFRRHYPYEEAPQSIANWQSALDAIGEDEQISEVLLSGGDPLTVGDVRLAELAMRIADIPHVRRLRIHTRLPIMIPQRVNDELLGWLTETRLTAIVVVHANHARELDEAVVTALARLVDAGIPVLNQAVLMRGINDSVDALAKLSEHLLDARVMPYYLHQLDRVQGAAHFEVPVNEGKRIVEQLRDRLPGYAVPRYVREVPGELSKLPIG
jgi:EF-P beta-lysylation protein EpmB